MPNDLGPQQKLPSIFIVPRRPVASDRGGTRAQEEQETPDWSVYVFGGGEGRFVIRNAFLDGNFFAANRPNTSVVQKEPLVIDGDAGFVVRYKWVRFTYHYVIRSPEFKTPLGMPSGSVNNTWHRYGTMGIMCGKGL